MKGFIIVIATLLAVPAAFAREQPLLARVTVYWARDGRGSDHYTRQHKCATGLRLRQGHCAVDPRRIPYGSSVVLPDGSRLAAVDTGSAVKTRKAARKSGRSPSERSAVVVDRFFETKAQALTWAATHPMFMPIKVLPPTRKAVSGKPQGQLVATTNIRTTNQTGTFDFAVKTATAAQPLLASNTPVMRNPLNKLSR